MDKATADKLIGKMERSFGFPKYWVRYFTPYINSLVVEDDHSGYLIGYAKGVDDTILRLQGQTDEEIARGVILEYADKNPGLSATDLQALNRCNLWLARKE